MTLMPTYIDAHGAHICICMHTQICTLARICICIYTEAIQPYMNTYTSTLIHI